MVVVALGFVFGAFLMQQQASLPALEAAWLLAPSLIVLFNIQRLKLNFYLTKACIFAFAALFGFFWAAGFAALRLSDALPKEWEQQKIELVGVVATLPEVTERGERFKFDVEKILTKEAVVPQHISLNFYREVQSQRPENAPSKANFFHTGERWQFTVRLKRPHSTYNPHGFDFESWALAENIRATGTIRSKSGYKKLQNFVWRPSYMVEKAREKIGNRISQTLASKPYAGVIRALVVGDDSQISAQDWNVYLRTGTSHLVSISGLHITMLAGLAFGVIAFAWRRIPSLVMRMPTRQAATLGGMLVAIVYACLAGLSVPTQRTLLMLMAFAVALLIGKKVPISRVLAIALLIVVLEDPWAVSAPGFWLSFGAIALIAYVSVSRMAVFSETRHSWLHEAANTQWAITIGMLPMLILMFGQASIVSPLANAFAIPVISLLVVPLAILGAILPLDFILQFSHWILQWCMHGLNWLAATPMATWSQAAPPIWTISLAIIGVLWMLLPRGFPQRWLGIILLLPMLIVHPQRPQFGEMIVAVLDVGQGLSVVIQTKNHTLLYDAGPRYSAQSDAGSKIIVPFLRGEGIAKLDGFIVSHDDADHSGGAASVLAQVPVQWLLSSFDLPESMLPKNLPKMPKQLHCSAGQEWVWDGVHFEVLYPSLVSYANLDLSDNNRSCVLKVTSQFGSILLSADIEKEAEAALLEANKDGLSSDVLIAPHHGSKTSSTIDFVQAVGAKHTIFTVGYLNRFKHPKPLIEKRYEESGAHLYRSDYQGALEINFIQNSPMTLKAWRTLKPKYWHAND